MQKTYPNLLQCAAGRFLVTMWLAFDVSAVLAHENHADALPPRVADNELFKPSPMPDRIILTWTGDPAHTQAVTWRTDSSIAKGFAEIAPAESGPKFAERAKRFSAVTEPLQSDASLAHYHSVNFTGLKPATKFAYRVGDGVNWTEWFHFTSASERPEPFSFIYFGDAQNDIRMHWSRVVREAFSDAPKARFMLHAGDLVSHSNVDSEWGEWFHAGGWLNAMIPSVSTPGNHEYPREADGIKRSLSRHWRPQFALPTGGPAGMEETVYALDYQGTRVISLNSNESLRPQNEWLDKTLADNPNRWTVVTFHHPVYSTKKNRDNPQIRAAWKPIFDKYRVDLVLNGHDHSYARTGFAVPDDVGGITEKISTLLQKNGSGHAALKDIFNTVNVPAGVTARSPEGGTVYVVSVSGPKTYEIDRQPHMKRAGQGLQLYQIIHVDGDRMRYEALTATGELYDAFTLAKRPSGKNDLIEQGPGTPEALPAAKPAETAKPKVATP
jgi:3',5'-cyclic AMP phosphodiesterase CpdA